MCGESHKVQQYEGKNIFQLHQSNAYTQLTGDKDDISNICWFKWYNLSYFCDSNYEFNLNYEEIGQVLDPVKGDINEMAKWILNLEIQWECCPA